MKARSLNNHGRHVLLTTNSSVAKCSPSSEQIKLFEIAIEMKQASLPEEFIVSAVRTALEFEGVADLMNLWANENDEKEKDQIIADLQEMIDACSQKEKLEESYVKFDDLDAIAKDVRAFKNSLYLLVMDHGGISKLSDLTGIPQPSLSRFFNSNAMPRRSTVLRISKALNLDKIKVDISWSK